MYTRPSIQLLLRGVVAALHKDIAPELSSSRAQQSLLMSQILLQQAIQRLQSEPSILVAEHNEMTALYRRLSESLTDCAGEAAERIRQRGVTMGGQKDIPAPYPANELTDAHHRLSEGLIATLDDLDQLCSQESQRANAALEILRAHLMVRTLRDFQTLMVNPGTLAGRE